MGSSMRLLKSNPNSYLRIDGYLIPLPNPFFLFQSLLKQVSTQTYMFNCHSQKLIGMTIKPTIGFGTRQTFIMLVLHPPFLSFGKQMVKLIYCTISTIYLHSK